MNFAILLKIQFHQMHIYIAVKGLMGAHGYIIVLNSPGLTELPVVLLGVLSQNGEPGCHGELVIKDSTGAIVCEVIPYQGPGARVDQ